MKKLLFYLIAIVILDKPTILMKTLALEQRFIPDLYPHPKDRIVKYIDNANNLFALSTPESALRAEHDMTLVVSELRRLPDTSIIPHALIFDTFKNQYSFTTDGTIKTFMERNENTAKTIYYSKLPPEKPVRL